MTIKDYLSRYGTLKVEIEALQERIEELESRARSPSSPSFEGTGAISSPKGEAKHERITDNCLQLKAKLETRKLELTEIQSDIERIISKVSNDRYRTILEKKYLNCQKLEQIALDMNYSYPQMCRLHGQALNCVPKDDIE